ncbi:MAG TPA: SDR family oxidoreductase [Jatrophihabitantaceae bacterium]|nr:SDR family oxidoreductase [Jatrophihabitantaceae bacterium]
MPNVLVTGAGRGIGKTTTLRLAAAGWDVYAGVRNEADGDALLAEAGERVHTLRLDVTSEDDLKMLGGRLPPELHAVVNNAGIAVGGPIEALRAEALREQLEVNVVGQVAVTQAVLPRLRASRGRIVLVSSISGRISNPNLGAYAASKFALEAIADALRIELHPWRIAVSLIEPGQIDTDIWRNAGDVLEETVAGMRPEHRELYAKHIDGMRKAIPLAQRMAASPDGVAKAIEHALTARRPKARYVIGATTKLQIALAGVTPTPMMDASLRKLTGVPRKP